MLAHRGWHLHCHHLAVAHHGAAVRHGVPGPFRRAEHDRSDGDRDAKPQRAAQNRPPVYGANESGKGMARPKGFEPLTPRFVVWCSIQLSYGRLTGSSLREATLAEAGDIKGSGAVGKPLVLKFCQKLSSLPR